MVAQTKHFEPSRSVVEAAAVWQAHLGEEHFHEEDRRAFQRWLDADPMHKLAFERMSAVAQQLTTRTPVERSALGMMFAGSSGRGAFMMIALVGSAAALACWGLTNQRSEQ